LPRNLSRETLDELAAMEDLPDDLQQAIAAFGGDAADAGEKHGLDVPSTPACGDVVRGDTETSPGVPSRPSGNGFAGARLQGLAGGMQRSGVSGILDEMSLDGLAPQNSSGIGNP